MRGVIYVCVNCGDNLAVARGEKTQGRRLAEALLAGVGSRGSIVVRQVECLNGCPKPCNAALRSHGKYTIRFSCLTQGEVPALLELSERYCHSADGNIPTNAFPAGLRDKLVGRNAPVLSLTKPLD
jgi:predicted metal-binding protein